MNLYIFSFIWKLWFWVS